MSESPDAVGQAIGWSSNDEQVRERFVAAWERAADGGPPPQLSDYLGPASAPDNAVLRRELESLDQFFRRHLAGDSQASAAPGDGPQATVELPSQRNVGTRGDRAAQPGDHRADADRVAADDASQFISALSGATRTFHPAGSGAPSGTDFAVPRAPAGVPTTVAGYEILGVLGRGGMGVVYKARQPGLKRVVALKMILAGGHAGEDDLGRFRSEAQAVARLQHPNIVQIYEVGDDEGRPYFSLEYVDGGCLTQQLGGRPMQPRQAAEMALVLTRAIAHAHAHGIIHRDLKPANVLLAKDGTPKITDFGLAKRLEDDEGQTRSGSILGTPDYMSPEQASGRVRDIGPRSDVYALGAMLYEFITGRVPLRGAGVLETLQQVVSKEPVAPTQLQPKLPRDLETICLKCLHKDPAKRYGTAEELGEDLRRFLANEPILARPIGTAERVWRACRRNPRVAGLSAAVIVLMVAWAASASALAVRLKGQKDATDAALVEVETQKNEAETQKNEAEAQRKLADRNAEQSRKNEEKANREAKIALQAEARAEESASVAKAQHAQSVDLLQKLGGAFQKSLQRRSKLLEMPELRGLQTEVFELLSQGMTSLAKEIEASKVSDFAMADTCNQLGELMFKFGHAEDALRQFEHAYELVRRVAEMKPEEDLPRANLALLAMQKGKMLLALNDADAARACFKEACDLRQQIADGHRGDFNDVQNHEQLSHFHRHLGEAELALGRPVEAKAEFQASLSDRQAWVNAAPGRVPAISYLSEAYMFLGMIGWHLGEAELCQTSFRKALTICTDLAQRFPNDFSFRRDLAEIYGDYCDAKLRLAMDQDAHTAIQRSLANLRAAIEHDPDDISMLPLLALTYERMAAVAHRLGQTSEVAQNYSEARKVHEELLSVDANNPAWQAAYALTLAHCGEYAEAAERMAQVAPRFPKSVAVQLQAARCYAVCATAAPEEQRAGYRQRAIEALRSATSGDFSDPVLVRTDPDLASLLSEPSISEMLARLEVPN